MSCEKSTAPASSAQRVRLRRQCQQQSRRKPEQRNAFILIPAVRSQKRRTTGLTCKQVAGSLSTRAFSRHTRSAFVHQLCFHPDPPRRKHHRNRSAATLKCRSGPSSLARGDLHRQLLSTYPTFCAQTMKSTHQQAALKIVNLPLNRQSLLRRDGQQSATKRTSTDGYRTALQLEAVRVE